MRNLCAMLACLWSFSALAQEMPGSWVTMKVTKIGRHTIDGVVINASDTVGKNAVVNLNGVTNPECLSYAMASLISAKEIAFTVAAPSSNSGLISLKKHMKVYGDETLWIQFDNQADQSSLYCTVQEVKPVQ